MKLEGKSQLGGIPNLYLPKSTRSS